MKTFKSILRPSTVALLAIAFSLSFSATLYAVDIPDLFELDGNAKKDGAGDDAAQVFCDVFSTTFPLICNAITPISANATVTQFTQDPVDPDTDDIFAGAKDSLDITKWKWKLGTANDKNDLSNVFVVAYEYTGEPQSNGDDNLDTGDIILYFGLSKFANNGDAAIGFWFLQNEIDPIPGSPKGVFSAGHLLGDVLVQADIENGGSISRFDIYTWGDVGFPGSIAVKPSQGDLHRILVAATCSDDATDIACGQVNEAQVPAPFPYNFKGLGTTSNFPPRTYFEGGLNLNAVFNDSVPCLRSFVAETRQSQSETAELEDLVYGTFDFCGFTVDKTGPDLSKVGDTANYTVTVSNTGVLPISPASIIDTLVGDLLDAGNTNVTSISDSCDSPLTTGQQCIIEYDYTVKEGDPDQLVNTVTATYDFGGSEIVEDDTHTVNLFTPQVGLDKKADDSDGPVSIPQGGSVDYTIEVSNQSSDDAPALNCTVTDPKLAIDPENSDGDNDENTLDIVLNYDQSHTISVDSGSLVTVGNHVNTASVVCDASGFTNGVTASDSVTVKVIRAQVSLSVGKTGDDYSKTGDSVSYVITIGNLHSTNSLTLTSVIDNLIGDLTDGTHSAIDNTDCPLGAGTLAAGATCTIDVSRITQGSDPDPLVNTVTVTGTDQFSNSSTKNDKHTVDLVAPGLSVTKSCLSGPVAPGASANFDIRIRNTGDTELILDISDPLLQIDESGVMLGIDDDSCIYGEAINDHVDGCYGLEGGVIVQSDPIYNRVDVTWDLPALLNLPNDGVVWDDATCGIEQTGDATRTLGFWKSHGSDGNFDEPVENGYTCHVARDHIGFGDTGWDIGWTKVMNCEDIFGIFWSSMGKESDGGRRGKVCKAKLQASWQLLAAILNDGLHNGEPPPANLIDQMIAALGGNNFKTIKELAGQLDSYNNSGDEIAIIDTDGAIIPNADPNGARTIADYTAGDCN